MRGSFNRSFSTFLYLELTVHWGSFIASLSLVLWQIHAGAVKYVSHPVATKTITSGITTPFITVCHDYPQFGYALGQFDIELAKYENEGKFSTPNTSAETVFHNATDQFYYVLDGTGKYDCLFVFVGKI
jgi:hypothetical protein